MPNTPSNESADENLEVLHFYSKVDEGLRQLDAGESIEHEEALKRMKKWLD